MRGRFLVRPQARRDIRDIANHIAADNLEASDRFIDEVYSAFQLLAKRHSWEAPGDSGVRVSKA